MKFITIKDKKIRYNEQMPNIDYIINIINNNYNLILNSIGSSKNISFIPTNESGTVYISNFDKYFTDLVTKVYNDKSLSELFNNPDLLPGMYIESLIRKHTDDIETFVKLNPNLDEETLYSLIAYKYFEKNGTFSDFIDYLKTRKETDVILNWLYNEYRFEAYNYLLGITVKFLKKGDSDILQSINNIISQMLNQPFNILNDENEPEFKLPTISLEELDALFINFLYSYNFPKDWIQTYEEIKASGRITFKKTEGNIYESECYRDSNGILRILITTDGTIRGLCSLVHEFIHYISMQKESQAKEFIISELPSIFFEKIAAEFLELQGYPHTIVDSIIESRTKNNLNIYLTLAPLFMDIIKYIEVGEITKKDKEDFWQSSFEKLRKDQEESIKEAAELGQDLNESTNINTLMINIEEIVNDDCDSLIATYIKKGLLIIDGYQYLLGTFLADKIIKKRNVDPEIISKMIYYTKELTNIDLKTILLSFDIENILDQDDIKENVLKKDLRNNN